MFRAPSAAGLPPLDFLLDDLHGTPAQIAKHLGIAPSTLTTYQRNGCAPRSVMLALFWETRWGLSHIDADLFNLAQLHQVQATALKHQVGQMASAIDVLERELLQMYQRGTAPAANAPVWRVG